jgi:hypothetical protein
MKKKVTARGLFIKNSSWQVKQPIPQTSVTFNGNCVKMCEYFAQNFGNKRTGCCITTTHCDVLPFSPGDFCPKSNTTVVPHPPYFSLFPRLEIKLEGRHFDTGDRDRMTSRMHLKMAEALGTVHTRRNYFECDGGQ